MSLLIIFILWQAAYFANKIWSFDVAILGESHPQVFNSIEALSVLGFALWGVIWLPYMRHSKEQDGFGKAKQRMQEEIDKLKECLVPKFEIVCDTKNPGCRREALWGNSQVQLLTTFYRLGVRAKSVEPIEGCFGRIVLITKNGKPVMDGESLTVTFAMGGDPDATAKTVTNQNWEWLDVIAICKNGQFVFPTPGFSYPTSVDPRKIFSGVGEYLFTVTISGRKTASLRTTLKLMWAGESDKAELELVKME